MVQGLVAVVVLFFLFRDRPVFARGLRGLLPLSEAEADRVARRAADAVHANLYANALTSLVDAVGAGLVFWAVGLPVPVLWAAVTFVVTLLPLVGSTGVWLPAAAFLALTGRWLPAAAVVGWGVGTWVVVDHLLYVRLVGDRLRLHPLLLLVAILGELAVFGVSGLVLGPAVLAVTEALLDAWSGPAWCRTNSAHRYRGCWPARRGGSACRPPTAGLNKAHASTTTATRPRPHWRSPALL